MAAQMLTVAVLAAVWCITAGELPLSIEGLRDIILPASGSLAIPLSLLWTGLVTTALTQFWETLAMKQVRLESAPCGRRRVEGRVIVCGARLRTPPKGLGSPTLREAG